MLAGNRADTAAAERLVLFGDRTGPVQRCLKEGLLIHFGSVGPEFASTPQWALVMIWDRSFEALPGPRLQDAILLRFSFPTSARQKGCPGSWNWFFQDEGVLPDVMPSSTRVWSFRNMKEAFETDGAVLEAPEAHWKRKRSWAASFVERNA